MKVFIHVEEIFPRVPVYHVGVSYKWGPIKFRYDYQPEKGWNIPVMGRTKKVELGKSKKIFFKFTVFKKNFKNKNIF